MDLVRSQAGAREVCGTAGAAVLQSGDSRCHRLRHKQERNAAFESGPSSSMGKAASGFRTGFPISRSMSTTLPSSDRACSNAVNHVGGVCQMNTGDILAGRPSLGAWVTYGLGSAKTKPADVRRHAGRQGNTGRRSELQFRLPSRDVCRNAFPKRRHARPEPEATGRNDRRTATEQDWVSESPERALRTEQARRYRTRCAHPFLRTRIPDAGRSAGSCGSQQRK